MGWTTDELSTRLQRDAKATGLTVAYAAQKKYPNSGIDWDAFIEEIKRAPNRPGPISELLGISASSLGGRSLNETIRGIEDLEANFDRLGESARKLGYVFDTAAAAAAAILTDEQLQVIADETETGEPPTDFSSSKKKTGSFKVVPGSRVGGK